MAIMDLPENGGDGNNIHAQNHPNKENTGGAVLSATTTTSTYQPVLVPGLQNRLLSLGPSPEKGSGQYRFRQMMERAPNPVSITNSSENNMSSNAALDNRAVAGIAGVAGVPSRSVPMGSSHYSPAPTAMAPHPFTFRTASLPFPGLGSTAGMPAQATMEGTETAQRVGNGNSNSNGNGNVNGNDGKRGSDFGRTATAILSLECQKRKFNPQFKEWVTRDGDFKCSVNLNGKTLHDGRTFTTAVAAKQALAKRAIEEVRKLPCPKPSVKPTENVKPDATKGHSGYAPVKPEPVPAKREDRGNRYAPFASVVPEPMASYYKPEYDRREEVRFLIGRVQALCGATNGPSPHILEDPVASRAFLEGFALGGRLEDSARRQYVEYVRPRSPPMTELQRLYSGRFYRHRERSPPPITGRTHRERSPIRRRVSYDA
ncbi:hypothetical protein F5B20DRAFT_336764 [Whalleya microplaca]|nr:hypothetical protein F5B20DRAFT_336764 [Whalleya microplaca]